MDEELAALLGWVVKETMGMQPTWWTADTGKYHGYCDVWRPSVKLEQAAYAAERLGVNWEVGHRTKDDGGVEVWAGVTGGPRKVGWLVQRAYSAESMLGHTEATRVEWSAEALTKALIGALKRR